MLLKRRELFAATARRHISFLSRPRTSNPGAAQATEEDEEEVPLACQTAIVKRRHRRTSAMPVSRYGSWAQQAELEAALLEDPQEAAAQSEDDSEGASALKVAFHRYRP